MKKFFSTLFLSCFLHGICLSQEVSLLFVGDAMHHQIQIDHARRNGGYDYSSYFQYLREEIQKADLSVVNLEVTLGGTPYKGYPQFSAPDEFAVALKDAGFDIFLTANNHVLDRGKKGVERTIRILDSLQVMHTGSFINQEEKDKHYPLLVTKNGINMAFLNYTFSTNGIQVTPPNQINYIDKEQIRKDIATAKKQGADILIANMHWGVEYKLVQNGEQESLARFLIEQGVNLVIGSHPHVVQPSMTLRDNQGNISGLVVYSMGNFVSGMKAVNTDGGQMIRVTLQKDPFKTHIKSCSYSLVYVDKRMNEGKLDFCVIPVEQAERKKDFSLCVPLSLDSNAYQKMMLFVKNSREIFSKHNQGIEEYKPGTTNFWENLINFIPENLSNAN